MRNISITAKITIWYTVFLVVITAALILVLDQAQNIQQRGSEERQIVERLADVSEMIEDDGGDFIYDKDIVFYQDDTYISIYDAEGELLVGRRPRSFDGFPKLSDKTSVIVKDTLGTEWYVYDSLFQQEKDPIWIRGMKKRTIHSFGSSISQHRFFIILPVFLLLVILGGWIISRRAFRPLREIIRTTDEIRSDADVSRRIPQGGNHDELYELTGSINGMFDRIENVLDREKQFASDVSHELKTPIAVIQSQSEYALEDPSYSEAALRTVNQQAKQMNNLVTRLLMLARSNAGTLPLSRENIDFSGLLDGIVEQQQIVCTEQDIELTAEIRQGIHVIADEDMLIRIILNLISNAVRYGKTPVPEGAPPVHPAGQIHVTLTEAGGTVRCTVADRGPGIPETEQEKVWDRFHQADHSKDNIEDQEPTAGLGLSIVKALTEAMDGTVSLKSGEGSGSAFTVQFPAAPAVKESEVPK